MTSTIWINPAHDTPELRALVRRANPGARIMGQGFHSEPTAAGDQMLMPGCEARQTHGTTAPQPDLWDAANQAGR